MTYKKFNIAKKGRKYTDKQTGEEKTYWDQVGILTEFTQDDGSVSRIISIPAIGLEASVFPIQPKNQQGGYQGKGTQQAPRQTQQQPPQTDEIDVENIPY